MNIFNDIIYKQGKDGRIFQLHWKYKSAPLAILAISSAISAGGAVYQGMAANAQGKSAQNMAKYNASLAEREAKMTEQKTAYTQKLQAEEAERRMSTLRAGLGASGVVTTEGSPLMIQSQQASEFEMENLMTGFQGRQEATALRSQASLDIMGGKIDRQKGKTARTASFIGAGSSLMQGFGGQSS